MTQPVLYFEPGSTWWPVLWGPVFGAAGAGVESLTGPVHWFAWWLVGYAFAGMAAVWVAARRRVRRVVLTPVTLQQGREVLEIRRIARVADVGVPVGARPLGGGWAVPRKTTEIPLELDDGTVVLAWASAPEEFAERLGGFVHEV
ncbi:hypothetical protein V5P93_006939 [Actinokineospora auranticolor]|uniref:DUF3093 family protein n=1 Tax=Actinokineospora auranticolor TaxID=155976 RepID=A0A2S6GW33_9PSEU|nr:hypothetical protein [Actinokineospora auranticolor]PPK69419.1 hypothetical protein CLV40_10325 [Actinokineospora auranticolor]